MVSRLRRRLDKLRLTLAILLLGFAINGTFETYTYINHRYPLPYAPSVFIIGPFVTLAGLLTLWIGRSDWDQPLSRRFRLAQEAFGLNVLALVLAITPVVWYGLWSDASIPSWVYGGFGAAIVVSLLFNFAIYVLVAYGLTANFGKALLLIAFGWASIVSIWTGQCSCSGTRDDSPNRPGPLSGLQTSQRIDFRHRVLFRVDLLHADDRIPRRVP